MSPEPNQAVDPAEQKVKENPGNKKAAGIIGGSLLAALLALCIFIPNPSSFQCAIVRFFMAVTAAVMAVYFMGGITVSGSISKLALKASGGVALFVIIQFFVDPFQLQTAVADAAPSVIPESQDVRKAQVELKARGAYTGPINGRLTSKTRDAIREVQTTNNLKVDGRLGTETKRLIIRRPPPDN